MTGTATQQDLMQLRGDLAVVHQTAQRARADAEAAATRAVDARLAAQTAESQRQTAALAQRLDGLTTSLTQLAARLDDLAARVDALGRQVRATPPATARPAPAPGAAPATAAPGARPATNGVQPPDIYQAAYIDFSKGSYALAMAGFREFLRRFPDHPLAGAAQYWIGECYVGQARAAANASQPERVTTELEQAVQEFRKVAANYPRSEKAPTALYKEALALIELKQPGVAQQRLEYLVANFPQAEETPLARERLAALKAR